MIKRVKRYLMPFALTGLLFACSVGNSNQEQDIRSAIDIIFKEGWNQGSMEAFDRTIADSVLFHYASSAPRVMTHQQMSEIVGQWRRGFPDLEMKVQDMVVQGNRGAARVIFTGTHDGIFAGVKPTGKRIEMALTMFFRFENGKMTEFWESDDQLGLRRQLGLVD